MKQWIKTALVVFSVSACSSSADQMPEIPSKKGSDELRVDPRQPSVPEQPYDKKDSLPENPKPADPFPNDCDGATGAGCPSQPAPASCTYKDVTITGTNSCFARAELYYRVCAKKEILDAKLVTCTLLEDPLKK